MSYNSDFRLVIISAYLKTSKNNMAVYRVSYASGYILRLFLFLIFSK